uniref:Uncharacterized protein n=1 Tax=Anguilla anguilla TaxID=7936 RepID=A0A0E9X254_ANGAN
MTLQPAPRLGITFRFLFKHSRQGKILIYIHILHILSVNQCTPVTTHNCHTLCPFQISPLLDLHPCFLWESSLTVAKKLLLNHTIHPSCNRYCFVKQYPFSSLTSVI